MFRWFETRIPAFPDDPPVRPPARLVEFLESRSKTKRDDLVERLLHSEDYVVRMRELWDVILMGRTKRDAQEDRRKQNGWWTFLENSFRTNRSLPKPALWTFTSSPNSIASSSSSGN